MHTVLLTLTLQKEITAKDEELYCEKRDRLIEKFEDAGWEVSVESEESDETEVDG